MWERFPRNTKKTQLMWKRNPKFNKINQKSSYCRGRRYKSTILYCCMLLYCIVLLLSINFNPTGWQGGGVNFVISQKLFNNNIYFYFSSIVTFTVFFHLFFEDKRNIILIVLLLIMFFSYQVYQRYYEPMFFVIFFTLFKTKLLDIFLKKLTPSILIFSYFFIYYLLAVSDIIYKIN